jgi:hypothetical protein
MKFKYLGVSKFGIDFKWNGDEVVWIFPWRRRIKKLKFLSVGFGVCYESLKDIDQEWEDYFRFTEEADFKNGKIDFGK